MYTDVEQTDGPVRYSHGGEHLLHGHGAGHGGAFLRNKSCHVDMHFFLEYLGHVSGCV